MGAGYAGVYGVGYYGKRDADAQFVGLKSAPCVNAFNVPVPCNAGYAGAYGVGYYGKRDAEAQFLNAGVYGAYGYTAPHGCCYSLWSYPFLQRWNLPQFCWCSGSLLSYSFTLKLTFPQIHWPKVRVVRQVVSNFVHKEF